MYFWRIEKLKQEMTERPLSEREALPYLVVFVVLSSAVAYIPQTLHNIWDGLEAMWSTLLAALGTIYIYRRNGGSKGQHFLQRYFALSWVIAIRMLVILIPLAVLFYGSLGVVQAFQETPGADLEGTQWYDFLILAAIEAVLYWRIGHHVGDLARRATPRSTASG